MGLVLERIIDASCTHTYILYTAQFIVCKTPYNMFYVGLGSAQCCKTKQICSNVLKAESILKLVKFVVSKIIFFWNKWLLLLSKNAISWSKVKAKTFLVLQKYIITNKCCSFECFIHQWTLKNKMHHGFHKNIDRTAVFNIDDNQKCCLSILLWFLKIMWHWRLLKIQLRSQD